MKAGAWGRIWERLTGVRDLGKGGSGVASLGGWAARPAATGFQNNVDKELRAWIGKPFYLGLYCIWPLLHFF